MSANAWLFLGTVLAALATVAGAVYTARTGRATNRESITAAPYGDMVQEVKNMREALDKQSERLAKQSDRITSQDRRLASLELDQSVLVVALTEQYEWQLAGAEPPPPTIPPPALGLLRLHMTQRAAETTDN